MDTTPNAVHWLQELNLLRLRINALNEKKQKQKCALERIVPTYGAVVTGFQMSMEDRIIALIETEQKLSRFKRDWRNNAQSAENILGQIDDDAARKVLRLLYLKGQKESGIRKGLGLSETAFLEKLHCGLAQLEEILNQDRNGKTLN